MALLQDLLAGGWLQNLLIGIVLLLVTPYIGSLMAGRSGTIIGAGVGITILVWIFVWVELRRTHKPPEIPQLPKTLHDYFRSDFNRTSDFESLASIESFINLPLKSGETITTIKVEARLYMDFDAKAERLLFYIPNTDTTYTICEHIARELYKKALNQLKSGILMESKSLPNERGVNISELKFTGGVFIYHEYPLFESNKDTLIPLFKTNGLSPQFRGSDYVNLRNNPSSSPPKAPSSK